MAVVLKLGVPEAGEFGLLFADKEDSALLSLKFKVLGSFLGWVVHGVSVIRPEITTNYYRKKPTQPKTHHDHRPLLQGAGNKQERLNLQRGSGKAGKSELDC